MDVVQKGKGDTNLHKKVAKACEQPLYLGTNQGQTNMVPHANLGYNFIPQKPKLNSKRVRVEGVAKSITVKFLILSGTHNNEAFFISPPAVLPNSGKLIPSNKGRKYEHMSILIPRLLLCLLLDLAVIFLLQLPRDDVKKNLFQQSYRINVFICPSHICQW